MLLRVGIGVGVFGIFVMLFSYDVGGFGLVAFTLGLACVLASWVTYLRDRPRRR